MQNMSSGRVYGRGWSWLWGAALCARVLAGCGGEDGPGSTETTVEGSVHRGENTVTATVDAEGAELILGSDARLVIPKGALDEEVEVVVERQAATDFDAPLKQPSGEMLAVSFEPHGLRFNKPIEIQLRLDDEDTPASKLRLARLDDPDDTSWEVLEDSRVLEAASDSELEEMPEEDRALYGSRRASVKSDGFSIYTVALFETASGETTDKLDVLFVVDNSHSMAQEQAALAEQLPRMVRILASGDLEDGQPDADGETGVADFPPVGDMHLGVVSANLGVPVDLLGESLPPTPSGQACVSPGDDGLLQFAEGCGGSSAAGDFLEFQAGDDVDMLGDDFACIADLGVEGCGFEQQLDSMLKALISDPSYTFYQGSTGHGGSAGDNAGFLRDDALLAVIVVTDEEDCSIPDANAALMSFALGGMATLTDTTSGAPISVNLATPLNLRCGTYPGALHPIARHFEGLRGLKPENPELVVFAAIAGIPPELEGQPAEDILNDPAMAFRSNMENDPFNTTAQPEPACTVPNPAYDPNAPEDATINPRYQATATPARRLVELAGQFGDNGTVRSICATDGSGALDYTGAIDTILDKISNQL